MKFYTDSEFNGFDGALISIAVVPEDIDLPPFYAVLPCENYTEWTKANVAPHLNQAPENREMAGRRLGQYLWHHSGEGATILADWPTDLTHLLQLLMVQNGSASISIPELDLRLRRLPGFIAAQHSAVPHNALEDAKALRSYCVEHNLG